MKAINCTAGKWYSSKGEGKLFCAFNNNGIDTNPYVLFLRSDEIQYEFVILFVDKNDKHQFIECTPPSIEIMNRTLELMKRELMALKLYNCEGLLKVLNNYKFIIKDDIIIIPK